MYSSPMLIMDYFLFCLQMFGGQILPGCLPHSKTFELFLFWRTIFNFKQICFPEEGIKIFNLTC